MTHDPNTYSNVMFIGDATRRKLKQQHDYSRIAGKLFAIFDLLCVVVRETQELSDDHGEPIMRRIGGNETQAEDGILQDALKSVCTSAILAMDAAEPDEAERTKNLRLKP